MQRELFGYKEGSSRREPNKCAGPLQRAMTAKLHGKHAITPPTLGQPLFMLYMRNDTF